MQVKELSAKIWVVLRKAVVGFIDDNALSRSAAMAFYATTSLAPVLLIVIAIAGLVVGRDAAELAVSAQLSGLLGPQGADLLKSVVQGAANTTSGIVAGSVALVTLLVSASGVFGEMQASLNQIWKVQPEAVALSALLRARAASLGLVAALGFLLLVSLVASAAISGLGELINRYLPFGTILLSITNTIVSVSLLALLFGAIYRVLPDRSLVMARRAFRCSDHGHPLHDRKVADWMVPRNKRGGLVVWGGWQPHCPTSLGVLLGRNLPIWCRGDARRCHDLGNSKGPQCND